MYSAILTINGKVVNFTSNQYSYGMYIKTISGLTGVAGKLYMSQHATGYGETYTDGTVSGQTIRIDGYILNNDTNGQLMRKQLIDTVVPRGTGTLKIQHVLNSDMQTELTIDVVVAQTPILTQEKHARFSLALYAPRPVWYASSDSATTVEQGTTATIRVDGQVDAEYSASIIAPAAALTSVTLTLDGGTRDTKAITLDLTRYGNGSVPANKTVIIRRVNGRLEVVVQTSGTTTVSAMQCLDVNSTFWYLPVGTHTLALTTNAQAGVVATVKYRAGYAGVIVSGV